MLKLKFRFILFNLLYFSCPWANGEVVESDYRFSMKSATYEPLSEANQVPGDLEFFELQLPFDFNFYNVTSRSVIISQTGSLDFESAWLYAFEGNFKPSKTRDAGIYYSVTGSTPNRVLKIEWRNFTAFALPDNCCEINFQVWLLEADCSIEIHFGKTAMESNNFDAVFGPGSEGPRIGLFRNQGPGLHLSGKTENPAINTRGFHMLRGLPSSGTVYRFTPTTRVVSASPKIRKSNQQESAQIFIGYGGPSHIQNLL